MTMACNTRRALGAVSLALAIGCAPGSLVDVAPTSDVADPAVVRTAAGATQLYYMAATQFASTIGGNPRPSGAQPVGFNFILVSGLWSDELMWVQQGFGQTFSPGVDERSDGSIPNVSADANAMYGPLQTTRVVSRQAREALSRYNPGAPPAWHGRLLAQEGYAIVFLAELFCSGIPLSTLSLDGDASYTAGFSTAELLTAAVALFDSAIAVSADSTRFLYLAQIGKGRALLDLGRFADAATAVNGVPTDFSYLIEVSGSTIATPGPNQVGFRPQNLQVRDNEGGNGLVWSTDPRTAIVTTPSLSGSMPVPGKYSVTASGTIDATVSNPTAPIRAADGLEARLIEAEAALSTGNPSWLTTLNTLRSSCIGNAACAPVPGLNSTNLPPNLTDPGAASGRLDLLKQERAMWLYLTGHRQGDLRRLAHLYNRDPMTLWPVGTYINPGFPPLIPGTPNSGTIAYVNQFVVPMRAGLESQQNVKYSGCNDMNP
jgi:hypothetical protein